MHIRTLCSQYFLHSAHQTKLINPLISLCSKALYAYMKIRWKNINNLSPLSRVDEKGGRRKVKQHIIHPLTYRKINRLFFSFLPLRTQKYDDVLIFFSASCLVPASHWVTLSWSWVFHRSKTPLIFFFGCVLNAW